MTAHAHLPKGLAGEHRAAAALFNRVLAAPRARCRGVCIPQGHLSGGVPLLVAPRSSLYVTCRSKDQRLCRSTILGNKLAALPRRVGKLALIYALLLAGRQGPLDEALLHEWAFGNHVQRPGHGRCGEGPLGAHLRALLSPQWVLGTPPGRGLAWSWAQLSEGGGALLDVTGSHTKAQTIRTHSDPPSSCLECKL